MHVVYVLTRSDQMSGPQVHLRDLACALAARGHRATVLVGGEGPFTRELSGLGVPWRALRHMVAPIRPWTDVRGLAELRAVLSSLAPELVSTHSSKAGVLGRMAAHRLGIPVLHTAHGWAFTRRVAWPIRRLYLAVERFAARYGRCIVTVSEFDRQAALAGGVGRAENVIAVHNGVRECAPELRAAPGASPPRLVMVARLERQKDHPTLLAALARLRGLAWTLDLVGDGPHRAVLEARVAALGLGGRVRFLGARDDVPRCLARSQLFTLISHFEGFPRSILEAMRAGLPVVATDVAGVAESVVDGETGRLVPVGDVDALVARLGELLGDPARRARMGRAARRRYQARFTFEHMFEGTLAVYRSLLGDSELPAQPEAAGARGR